MIIDFHAHTFPEQIAKRAIAKLSDSAHIKSYSDGTLEGLKQSMKTAGIDCAVLLPVVTKPAQQEDINRLAIETNEHFHDTGILSFGGIHPDNENYKEILKSMAQHGIPGVKLHPVFQKTYFDDIRYLRIMDCACENGLIILIHAGLDASFPDADYVIPGRIRSALEQVQPDKLVLAHMGGWGCWEEAEELLADYNVYLDTAFTLSPLRSNTEDSSFPSSPLRFHTEDSSYAPLPLYSNTDNTDFSRRYAPLRCEQFLRMVKSFGIDHILFGTDSPWSDMAESLELVRESGLTASGLEAVLGGNAARLLGSILEL